MNNNLEALFDAFADVVADKVIEKLAGNAAAPARSPRRLLPVDEAAMLLGRTPQAVYHLIGQGKLPAVRSDRRVFVDSRDLDRFIEGNKVCNN
jgi:excisionase family DNA binding protein